MLHHVTIEYCLMSIIAGIHTHASKYSTLKPCKPIIMSQTKALYQNTWHQAVVQVYRAGFLHPSLVTPSFYLSLSQSIVPETIEPAPLHHDLVSQCQGNVRCPSLPHKGKSQCRDLHDTCHSTHRRKAEVCQYFVQSYHTIIKPSCLGSL